MVVSGLPEAIGALTHVGLRVQEYGRREGPVLRTQAGRRDKRLVTY